MKLDKVLHVENDEAVLGMVRNIWKDWNIHQERSTRDGLQRIEREGNNYQLIILDPGLEPDATDEDRVETVRLFHACSVSPIVVFTGSPSALYTERAAELGVFGVIEKASFSQAKVGAIVENAVRKWREERFTQTLDTLTARVNRIALHRRKVLQGLEG